MEEQTYGFLWGIGLWWMLFMVGLGVGRYCSARSYRGIADVCAVIESAIGVYMGGLSIVLFFGRL